MKSMKQMQDEMFEESMRIQATGAEYPKLKIRFPGVCYFVNNKEQDLADEKSERQMWIVIPIVVVALFGAIAFIIYKFS